MAINLDIAIITMGSSSFQTGQFFRQIKKLFGIKSPDPFSRVSFSQEGEDLILSRFMEPREKGWYVDVGAHHPKRYSNTYLFYLKGWSGLNIDAMPGSMSEFKRLRPRDINIETAVAEHEHMLTYHVFNVTALNTFDETLAADREKRSQSHIVEKLQVKCRRLDNILDEYLPENQHIDFMSVDAEGMDLEVLRSNDWNRFRPEYLVAECMEPRKLAMDDNPIVAYLKNERYTPVAKCFNSVIFYTQEFSK